MYLFETDLLFIKELSVILNKPKSLDKFDRVDQEIYELFSRLAKVPKGLPVEFTAEIQELIINTLAEYSCYTYFIFNPFELEEFAEYQKADFGMEDSQLYPAIENVFLAATYNTFKGPNYSAMALEQFGFPNLIKGIHFTAAIAYSTEDLFKIDTFKKIIRFKLLEKKQIGFSIGNAEIKNQIESFVPNFHSSSISLITSKKSKFEKQEVNTLDISNKLSTLPISFLLDRTRYGQPIYLCKWNEIFELIPKTFNGKSDALRVLRVIIDKNQNNSAFFSEDDFTLINELNESDLAQAVNRFCSGVKKLQLDKIEVLQTIRKSTKKQVKSTYSINKFEYPVFILSHPTKS